MNDDSIVSKRADPLQMYGGFSEGLSETDLENLASLDTALHALWGLGRNIALVWTPMAKAISVVVIPHYTIIDPRAGQTTAVESDPDDFTFPDTYEEDARSFIDDIMAGDKKVSESEIKRISAILNVEPQTIELPFEPGDTIPLDTIDAVFRRYSISYVEDRAVCLFDIVNFSLYTPLEQVTQLNSLAYSVNAAHSKLLDKKIDISFTRTTTGDGFYIWNRDHSVQANVNLYHFMHLVLADNAIARNKAIGNTTPELRASFHVGSHYEFYQSESLSPTMYSYIVGKVTIELARMIDRALPGQVLVGDFKVPMLDKDSGTVAKVDSIKFIEKTQSTLSSLKGLSLSGEGIDSINCYLTGERNDDGTFGIKRYLLSDKHGKTRSVFNAKINIYRDNADPIFLGVQEKGLANFKVERVDTVPES